MSQTPASTARTTATPVDVQRLQALLNAGQAHHGAGRLGEAEACYRQILEALPNQPDALHLLGVIALQVGKPAPAVELFAQAIRNGGGNAGVFSNLCMALRRLGRLDEAVAAGQQAVKLDANLADAYNNLANVLMDKQMYGEAADALQTLIRLRPAGIDNRLQLARALILSSRHQEAADMLLAFQRTDPAASAGIYVNLGVALKKLGRTAQAADAYRVGLLVNPSDEGLLNNLGSMLLQEDDGDPEAVACLRHAIAAKPDFADAHLNMSLAYRGENRIDESIASARTALRFNPQLAEAHTSVSFGLLLKGELEEGFRAYEWRTLMTDFPSPKRSFTTPVWDGRRFEGMTILIHDEQGVGDAIQFARYAQMVRARGARVIVECNTQLVRLLSAMPGIDGVIGRFTPLPAHDAHVSLLSLPHQLGTTLDSIPADVPYLKAEPELTAQWADRMGPRKGLRVGLVWAGNPEFKDDRNRSPRLGAVLPLLDVPGVEFFALQKGAGRQDLETYRDRLPANFVDLGDGIGNFADTAAIMMNLDLVISSCTAPPHLAGALARPTWTILPFNCDWRWLLEGDTTPWYPTMRLFRQERRGDWGPVVARVREALAEAARTAR
ncbi:tetratricopeptide repeat protein [Azospirillum sp.]|uniref:tetratricopeptide repeat protein n=1 Tax=Azospirillum sp. TaxID=34012 RepID=UPI003D733D4E